jgi:hypothetical protein
MGRSSPFRATAPGGCNRAGATFRLAELIETPAGKPAIGAKLARMGSPVSPGAVLGLASMRITRIEAHDFLAFDELSLEDLSPTLSVVVGPNGAGKSSLRRTLELVDRAVRWSAESNPDAWERLRGYTGAIRRGAATPRYWVRVGLELTEPEEQELVAQWLRFAVLSTALRNQPPRSPSRWLTPIYLKA